VFSLGANQVNATAESNFVSDMAANIVDHESVGIQQMTDLQTSRLMVRQTSFGYDYNVINSIAFGRTFFNATGVRGPVRSAYGATVPTSGGSGTIFTTTITSGTCASPCPGPVTLTATPTNAQVGDTLCNATQSTATGDCGVITNIAGNVVTMGGPSLTTFGVTGLGGAIASGGSIWIFNGYHSDGSYYLSAANRGNNDLYVSPQFFDDTCTVQTWATAGGISATFANVEDQMVRVNGFDLSGAAASMNTYFYPSSYQTYIRRCFTPYNGQMKSMVKDSTRCADLFTATGRGGGTSCDPGALDVYNAAI